MVAVDGALADLINALPEPEAATALRLRRDSATADAVRSRLEEAAAGLCDYNWDQNVIDTLAPSVKGRVKRAYNALAAPIARRVNLLRALALDLTRRQDAAGDAALAALLVAHRWRALPSTLAPEVVAAEPSPLVLEALAARLEEPQLTATDDPLIAAAIDALFALGEERALARAPSLRASRLFDNARARQRESCSSVWRTRPGFSMWL